MLKRIKYLSRFARPLGPSELEDIASVAEKKNQEHDLTGILMTSGGIFFQVFEGPQESVDRLWETLQIDPRHKDILLLQVEEGVEKRAFPDWRMKRLNLDDRSGGQVELLRAIMQTVLKQMQMIYDLTGVLERAAAVETADGSAP